LKASIVDIVIPITAITNKCIDQCIFPDTLKIANVMPLYKKGSQHTRAVHKLLRQRK